MAATTTTTTTVDSTITSDHPLQLDAIPTVDLRLLSQSELYSLSLCSDSAFDLRRCDDVVIPTIDRSVFNESAGSRKQTYSRLRLAPAASSTTIHRRTPHLRTHIPPSISISSKDDPELAENSQIINFLKGLFKSDPKYRDLVPIEVECTNPAPEVANPVTIVGKRKRGRPKRDEIVVPREVKPKGLTVNNVVKKAVVFNNVEDNRDKEIVNGKGVVLDIVKLGELDDPYGPEISRRTEGMTTSDQLLGFLKGLNGQWGSRRRKKRVVDASDFGDALPKGWRLSLSIKKKVGRVWLFCRRYISPSGRQFASCRDVSAYLLSILGPLNSEKLNCTFSSNNNEHASNVAPGNVTDLVLQEDNNKIYTAGCYSSSLVTSLPRNPETQAMSMIGNTVENQGEKFECPNCAMNLNGKDDLLQHHLLCHRRKRSKGGASLTDGVIILKDGKYECQFCHKTFDERRRYNGHIGAHVRYEGKSAETLATRTEGKDDRPFLSGVILDGKTMAQASKVADFRVVTETSDDLQVTGNGSVLAEESSDNHVRNRITSNAKVCCTDGLPDIIAAKSDLGVARETSLSDDDNNSRGKPSSETHVTDSVIRTKTGFLEQEASGSCMVSLFQNEQTSDGVENNVIAGSAHVEVPNEEAVSEIGSLPSNTSGEIYRTGSPGDKDFTCTVDESTLDTDEVANGSSLSGFCNTHAGLDEDGVSKVKQHSTSKAQSIIPQKSEEFIEKENGLMKVDLDLELNRSSLNNILIPSGDEDPHGVDRNSNTPSSSLPSARLDSKNEIRSNQGRSFSGSDAENVTSLEEEENYESCSAFSSLKENVCTSESKGNVVSTCMAEEPRRQINGKSMFPSGCEPSCHIENNVAEASTGELEVTKPNEFQAFENEPDVPVDGNEIGQNPSVMTIATEKNLEFCSLVPSGNEQTFDLQDDVTGIYDSAMEDCKDESSERGLLNHFCIAETSDDVFGNKLYNSPLDALGFEEDRDIGNHELSLAFGNPHGELYADTTVEQKRDLVNRSFVSSENNQGFGVQTNLSMVNNSMVHNLKEARGSMSDLFSLSSNSGTNSFVNNLSTVYTGREWEGRKMDDVGNSVNKNYMDGFGSSPYQPAAHAMPSAMWRTGERNALQSRLADPSHPLVQSPSCFRTFDIISDKVDDGLFRLGDNYSNVPGVDGFRPVRSEPVEFSFLTAHNSNSLQENSKVFQYGTEMGHEFNPSFWLGKDAMMPNIVVNQVTAVCVWCRNEFQHDPGHSGIQAGNGAMCLTCSARISQQVNIL